MKKNALVDNVLPPLVCTSMLIALAAALLYAPTEKIMGDTQRIFYFHVPAAISAFVCFFLVFLGIVQYLRTSHNDTYLVLMLEYASGGSVADQLDKHAASTTPFEQGRVCLWLAQLSSRGRNLALRTAQREPENGEVGAAN